MNVQDTLRNYVGALNLEILRLQVENEQLREQLKPFKAEPERVDA